MPKRIRLRALTADEKTEIRRLAASRKEAIRLVQRARIIAAVDEDPELTATEAGLRAGFKSNAVGARWANRFIDGAIIRRVRAHPPVVYPPDGRVDVLTADAPEVGCGENAGAH